MGHQNSQTEATSDEGNLTVTEAKQQVSDFIAEPGSEEGQEVIHGDSHHVSEVWEDGEITSTKSGDLYGARSLHQSFPPIVEGAELLFEVPEGQDHKRMVITDFEGLYRLLINLRKTVVGDDHVVENMQRELNRLES